MWPGWEVMWMIAFALYAGCKCAAWRTARLEDAPAWKRAAFLFAWPGMDAEAFVGRKPLSVRPSTEWLAAAARGVFGLMLFFGVARKLPPAHHYLAGWTGMIGLALILHFGVFDLLACFWRLRGLDARPLMNHPLQSQSIGEFWGRRWNTAFRDLTHRFLFRPLTAQFGPRWGLFAGFIFSGVVHELVISVPAQGGYGGPTFYFFLQGAGIVIERSAVARQMGIGSGRPARAFTILVVAGPLLLLFHRPFVERVIVPFMRAAGALP
jgi:hypothetical protein